MIYIYPSSSLSTACWCESREVSLWTLVFTQWTLWPSRARIEVEAEREGRSGGEGRKVVFVYSPAYLDWFHPQQQPVGAPALHPLSSPQHPDFSQPCDSGLEPRGLETDRREGRERGETDRGRLDFIYQFHFQSNRAKFSGWRFVSNHLSAQFIKRPSKAPPISGARGEDTGSERRTKSLFLHLPSLNRAELFHRRW